MDQNETIHGKRLLLLATVGLAIIFLVYLVSADAGEVQSSPHSSILAGTR